jgi:hypothetical protein
MAKTRTQIIRQLSTDDTIVLLQWFTESYHDGWRPTIQSHVEGISGRINTPTQHALCLKAKKLLQQINENECR